MTLGYTNYIIQADRSLPEGTCGLLSHFCLGITSECNPLAALRVLIVKMFNCDGTYLYFLLLSIVTDALEHFLGSPYASGGTGRTVPNSPRNTGRPGSGGTSINPSRGMVGVTSFYFLSFSTLFVHFASCLSLLCTLCDGWCLSRCPIISVLSNIALYLFESCCLPQLLVPLITYC